MGGVSTSAAIIIYTTMAARVIALLLLAACFGPLVIQGHFQVDVFENGAYDLKVHGVSWLPSGPTFFINNGTKYCSREGTLKLLKHESVTGEDKFGAWNKTTFSWKAGPLLTNTSIKVYQKHDVPVAVFSQTYSTEATNTSGKDRDDIISSFPSFWYPSRPEVDLGYLSYGNDMAGWVSLSLNRWNKDSNFSTGIQGGPLVLFNKKSSAMVISPLSNFMAASSKKFMDKHLSYGIMGLVDKVPAGFTSDFVVSYSHRGVRQAMKDWGSYVTRTYNKTTKARDNDLSLSHLGYWTDNGAYYYYNTMKGKNYEDTMLEQVAYLKNQGLPIKYLQIDSWFYTKGHVKGARTWEAKKTIFPHGFKNLYEKTSLPIGCHNRYWDNDTTYASYNGGKYNFISDRKTGYAVPDDQQFWIDLFGATQKWGKFILYEQDWLNQQTDRNLALVSDLTLGRRWLVQMGQAAEKFGISIQYCMSYSRHILQSVEIPAVTQARVTDDYQPGKTVDFQYKLGITAMFADALNLASSKDTFWSTRDQPGNPYHGHEKSPYTQTLIATLSGGPVGPGDGLGYANTTLLKSCCDSDGKILRGDHPLTIMDKSLKAAAFKGTAPTGQGEMLYSTLSSISGHLFGLIIADRLDENYHLVPTDLTPDYKLGAHAPYIYFEDDKELHEWSTEKPFLVGKEHCGNRLCVLHSTPVFETTEGVGLSLLGEIGTKFAPVSSQRFSDLRFQEVGSLEVKVNINPGEMVTISFARVSLASAEILKVCCDNRSGETHKTGKAHVTSDGVHGCELY